MHKSFPYLVFFRGEGEEEEYGGNFHDPGTCPAKSSHLVFTVYNVLSHIMIKHPDKLAWGRKVYWAHISRLQSVTVESQDSRNLKQQKRQMTSAIKSREQWIRILYPGNGTTHSGQIFQPQHNQDHPDGHAHRPTWSKQSLTVTPFQVIQHCV